MKTKVRTQEYSQNGYNFMSIEVLSERFAGHLNPIGHIRFRIPSMKFKTYLQETLFLLKAIAIFIIKCIFAISYKRIDNDLFRNSHCYSA